MAEAGKDAPGAAHSQPVAGAAAAAAAAEAGKAPAPPPRRLLTPTLSLPAWVLDEAAGLGSCEGGGARYSVSRDVILRLEVVSNTQCKVLAAVSLAFWVLAVTALVAETWLKLARVSHRWPAERCICP